MLTLLLAAQIAANQTTPPARSSTPSDSAAIRARVDSAIVAFLREWRGAWEDTERKHPLLASSDYVRDGDERGLALHCHWDNPKQWLRNVMIRSAIPAQGTCPRWYPPGGTPIDDERQGIDNGLDGKVRPLISLRRSGVRYQLDSAAKLLPGDLHLTGQRVRFALDARDVAGAARAALSCTGNAAQCSLLQALVLYRLGDVARADSSFAAAAAQMGDSERCAWNDVRALLDEDERVVYERLSCADRAQFEAQLWWLADPLWIEAGNERRVEHFARRVMISLAAAFGEDERQRFTPRKGGDAVIESLVRYGWPSHMFWGGPGVDRAHGGWLLTHVADTAAPYVVREYTRERRYHVLPSLRALNAPFEILPDPWEISAPNGDDNWWPVEHYARDASDIAQFPVGQSGMLRRRDVARFVWAADVDSAVVAGRLTATVFESRSVAVVKRVASATIHAGKPIALDASLREGPTLIGIEIPGDSTRAAMRARFGATIAEPLSALGSGRALSEPLLIDPPADAARVDDSVAVARMYGSATFAKLNRIGVYWESYGFRANDTLDVELRITREDQPNVVQRAIRVLGLGSPAGGSVGVRWREVPGSNRSIQRLEGDVPVQMRSIVVELSRLARGRYRLQLAMNRPGEAPSLSERMFELR